jgi:gamma-glutamylcyclotransferase (GGCT)/AIG2-like uncharacterized protein YtfP
MKPFQKFISASQADKPMPFFPLFVYGTLKRGFSNHSRFIPGGSLIQPAWITGNLYDSGCNFPYLDIPEKNILARGSRDPGPGGTEKPPRKTEPGSELSSEPDAKTGSEPSSEPSSEPGFGRVEGELVYLTDPEISVPPIDRLEGFDPRRRENFYERVQTLVQTPAEIRPAWVYIHKNPANLIRKIPSGIWIKK